MAHNTRIRIDGAWMIGPPVLSGEWLTLDTNLTKALNGDGGGTWTPTSVVTIGGAGMWFAGQTVTFGGTSSQVSTSVSANKHIVHDDNDHVVLASGHAGRSRTLVTTWARARAGGERDIDTGLAHESIVSTVAGANFIVPLAVHNGATFASATFRFAVSSNHGPPAILPRFRVFSLDKVGNRTSLVTNGAAGYVQFTPTPASGSAWFSSGAAQAFTVTLDGGVIVDTSTFTYWAEVVDEDGAGALPGNSYFDIACAFTNITDLRPQ